VQIAVVNLKGGVGKTTTSMFLGALLAEQGPTLVVDADPQGSARSWAQRVPDLPMTVIACAGTDIHQQLPKLMSSGNYQHAIIDTPPELEQIVQSALLAADIALVPLAPSLMEQERLDATLRMLERVESVHPLNILFLLVRVRPGTTSARLAPSVLGEDFGLPVLEPTVPLRERYMLAFGEVPEEIPAMVDGHSGGYRAVLAALNERERGSVV
jgi:chromosome partitioning protein